MLRVRNRFIISILVLFTFVPLSAQEEQEKSKEVHQFTMLYQAKATTVKDQGNSGTCWSFATTSFIESELLRMGKGEYDLSEMYFVRNTYPVKSEWYVRYHGRFNFGEGGQAHDVMNVIRKFGLVPQEIYDGNKIGEDKPNHGEMTAVLQATLDAVLKKSGGKLTPLWKDVIDAELNIYLGDPVEKFEYNGENYTPKSFAAELDINPEDYIELTSYIHHPFYKRIDLEIPDNFTHDLYYNIPIDELVEIMDYALENGYSVAWDGDVGRDNFFREVDYAVVPVDSDTKKEKKEPEVEKMVTQEMRQKAFDDFTTTDDHIMHVTGFAKDQDETKFYYTKNSWGTKDKKYDGYWYMSESYVKLRTIAIMVHKDAIPSKIKSKLGI
ncbi:MAG: aminopeptidase [Ignavibacteria bacterium RBG_13_36_8]|nr:MAG: aminopeptidase [Ignavibacteria bacterium RBG_13_36_8]